LSVGGAFFAVVASVEHPPFDAYRGAEPFIFVSYSHRDGQAVFAEIRRLHELGYRIWYDEGIDPGKEWSEDIARALHEAAAFIVFISVDAVLSNNVRNEINFALSRGKPFLAVHLDDVKLPLGLELGMANIQAIYRSKMPEEHYHRKLDRSLLAATRNHADNEAGVVPAARVQPVVETRPIPAEEPAEVALAEVPYPGWLRPVLVDSVDRIVFGSAIFCGSMLFTEYINHFFLRIGSSLAGVFDGMILGGAMYYFIERGWTGADFRLGIRVGSSFVGAALFLVAVFISAGLAAVVDPNIFGTDFFAHIGLGYVYALPTFVTDYTTGPGWFWWSLSVGLEAFLEEVFCFSYLFGQVASRRGPLFALIIVVLLRTGYHAGNAWIPGNTPDFVNSPVHYLAETFLVFTLFGLVYWRTRKTWPLVLAHVLLVQGYQALLFW
jgi:membrane protease YdiL (CAAX protease family)